MNKMETLQHSYAGNISLESKKSLIGRFMDWCQEQEKNRLGWLAVILAGHGCVFTPLTVLFVVLAGNNPVFWPLTIGAMGLALVTNLAALPTKITIPVFFLSLLVDLVVIVNCIAIGLSF
jgi:hypothetical protein